MHLYNNESCGMSIVITRPELLAYMYMFKYFAVKATTTLFCQLYRQRIDNVIYCCMWYCCSTEPTLWCWTMKPNVNTHNYSFNEFCHCDSFKALKLTQAELWIVLAFSVTNQSRHHDGVLNTSSYWEGEWCGVSWQQLTAIPFTISRGTAEVVACHLGEWGLHTMQKVFRNYWF